MFGWRNRPAQTPGFGEQQIRRKYALFRELLARNNECLELFAGIQEDLQFVPPLAAVFSERIDNVFDRVEATVAALENLSGVKYDRLRTQASAQRADVSAFLARIQELDRPDLSVWLSDVTVDDIASVGGKAAVLGEIKNQLRMPVPEGYVLTADAYRQFWGIPHWETVRDAARRIDLNDLAALQQISASLSNAVLAQPLPRAVEVAIEGRAHILAPLCSAFAVRSSAVGEGGVRTFAGQFESVINVLAPDVTGAYRRVIAGRFSERALFYRLSAGISDVSTPMAVLVLGIVRARAAGILYTRDPGCPRADRLWITATHGFGIDVASGRSAADLFVLDRRHTHAILERTVVPKSEEIVALAGGGMVRQDVAPQAASSPSLSDTELCQLAEWGLRIERHFGSPQDIEWAIDPEGQIWILQARDLVLAETTSPPKLRSKQEPVVTGGRTIFPGRVSGPAYLVNDPAELSATPDGAIVFVRRPAPEMVRVFPRIAGLVAEWGNVAGHGSSLLREFKVPSVFQMAGAFETLRTGDPVSLDAVQPRIFRGILWTTGASAIQAENNVANGHSDPLTDRFLMLHLLDPAASNFRPSGCTSAHDILRFCHEKAIETMFEVNDVEMERVAGCSKKLLASVPIHLHVLDLGGGLSMADPSSPQVKPEEISSRPFQALWRGITHPNVTWTRRMPATLSDLASVMASSLTPETGAMRALGESSYLLVADEYMNLNSRLAYHFSLVDACLSDVPSNNYVSFRFAGGGAASGRRDLRARFLDAILTHYGFRVDRRGDLVNAWFKKGSAGQTAANLDILGRLLACSAQLDMYMTNRDVMRWYVQQFLKGNYSFEASASEAEVQTSAP